MTISDWRQSVYSAAIADALDQHGFHNQVADPRVVAIAEGMVVCGLVRTGLYMPIFSDGPETNVYEHEIALVDDLKPDEVPVLVCNGDLRITPWGELLSTRAAYLGAGGCVTDGCIRDARKIVEMNFPVFSAGRNPVDTKYRGKMMAADVPAVFAGVAINSGDLVFGDEDGVVFVPAHVVDVVMQEAYAKATAENTVREDLARGESLKDTFERYGIL